MAMKKKTINLIRNLAVMIAAYAVLFALSASGVLSRSMQNQLIPIGINIILAVSLNLTVGFLGELTLGHAGFMSVGAYAGCIFAVNSGLPDYLTIPLAMLIGGLFAAIFGVIIGVPALRLKGDYLAIVTLAFGEIVRSLFTSLSITGGALGLQKIPKHASFTLVYVVMVLTVILIANLVHSRHGRSICAIRDNIIAAEATGVNVVYFKLLAFVIAAFFAGVAGVLYGFNIGQLKPVNFDFNKSIEILVMVVLGGMGSIPGSMIAAVIITLLPELLRGLAKYRLLIYAVVLIAMMILNASPKFLAFKEKLFRRGQAEKGTVKE